MVRLRGAPRAPAPVRPGRPEAEADLRFGSNRVRDRRRRSNPRSADPPRARTPQERRRLGRVRSLRRALGQGRVGQALRDHGRRAPRHLLASRGARSMNGLQLALPGVLADSVEWVWSDDFDEVADVKRYEHSTVMRDEVVRALGPRPGGVYGDATLGGGGHPLPFLAPHPNPLVAAIAPDRNAPT